MKRFTGHAAALGKGFAVFIASAVGRCVCCADQADAVVIPVDGSRRGGTEAAGWRTLRACKQSSSTVRSI
jgi:hypothetical protein